MPSSITFRKIFPRTNYRHQPSEKRPRRVGHHSVDAGPRCDGRTGGGLPWGVCSGGVAGTRFPKAEPDTALVEAEDFFPEHPEIPLIHSSATHTGKYPYGISRIRNPKADVDS